MSPSPILTQRLRRLREDRVAFAEGHSLDDAASKARVPMDALGGMLTLDEAKQVLKRLDAGRHE